MKLTNRYQLVVWSWDPRKLCSTMVKNEKNISRRKVVSLRSFYEEKGFEVKSWALTEAELSSRTA